MSIESTSTGEPVLPLRLGPLLSKEYVDDNLPPDWLRLKNCPDMKCLEDYYELCPESKWKNGRPVWSDGQNYIWMPKTKYWSVSQIEDSIEKDMSSLCQDRGGVKKYPNQVRSWRVANGRHWRACSARVEAVCPPYLNVMCDDRPEVNGCYCKVSDENAEFPIWGHGMKRLYATSNCWAICLNPASMEENGGVLCSSLSEPPRDRPQKVQNWVFHNGSEWVKTSTSIWSCTRPPPVKLQITCPEMKELNGTYKLYKEEINGKPAWIDGDNLVYINSYNKCWTVSTSKADAQQDMGFLQSKLQESRMPDRVEVWMAYFDNEWTESRGSSCIVPESGGRKAFTLPVFGNRPSGHPTVADIEASRSTCQREAEPKAKAKAKPKAKAKEKAEPKAKPKAKAKVKAKAKSKAPKEKKTPSAFKHFLHEGSAWKERIEALLGKAMSSIATAASVPGDPPDASVPPYPRGENRIDDPPTAARFVVALDTIDEFAEDFRANAADSITWAPVQAPVLNPDVESDASFMQIEDALQVEARNEVDRFALPQVQPQVSDVENSARRNPGAPVLDPSYEDPSYAVASDILVQVSDSGLEQRTFAVQGMPGSPMGGVMTRGIPNTNILASADSSCAARGQMITRESVNLSLGQSNVGGIRDSYPSLSTSPLPYDSQGFGVPSDVDYAVGPPMQPAGLSAIVVSQGPSASLITPSFGHEQASQAWPRSYTVALSGSDHTATSRSTSFAPAPQRQPVPTPIAPTNSAGSLRAGVTSGYQPRLVSPAISAVSAPRKTSIVTAPPTVSTVPAPPPISRVSGVPTLRTGSVAPITRTSVPQPVSRYVSQSASSAGVQPAVWQPPSSFNYYK